MAIETASTKPARALIIHGWNDNPSEGWLGWLTDYLQAEGYEVCAPHMKTDVRPLLQRWNEQVARGAEGLGGNDIIIAHSLGCFLALRLLEGGFIKEPIRKVLLVSGFFDAPNDSASKFFEPEPNWQSIRTLSAEFICIGSSDDAIVTPDRTRRLAHKLDAKLIMFADKGHFLGSRGMATFPEILELID